MKKIGIIGAMEIEVAGLKEQMRHSRSALLANMEFVEGILCGTEAVVVKCGVGKVNAAVCTQILSDRFGVDGIINTGVAGSLNAKINILDYVISTDVVHHDVDATNFGYAPGEVPQLGMRTFKADPELIEAARKACLAVCPQQSVFCGRVASGDQFIRSRETKEHIRDEFDALCTEMEGAAIAQTAWLNHLPFVVIRCISDKADDSVQMDYPVFENTAAHNCTRLVCALMEGMKV